MVRYTASALVAVALTCSAFDTTHGASSSSACPQVAATKPRIVEGIVFEINVVILPNSPSRFGTCPGEFPRITWTIEPAPDGQNYTTLQTFPEGMGEIALLGLGLDDDLYTNDDDLVMIKGIRIDEAALDGSDDAGVLIQVPKDQLESVTVPGTGSPFFVNVEKGFVNIHEVSFSSISPESWRCPNPYGGFTYQNLAGSGPVVVADLSSSKWNVTSIRTRINNYSPGCNMTIALPPNRTVDVGLHLSGENSVTNIKGNINCPVDKNGFSSCRISGEWKPDYIKLLVDGSISGSVYVGSSLSVSYPELSEPTILVAVNDPKNSDPCSPFTIDPLFKGSPDVFKCKGTDDTVELKSLPCTTPTNGTRSSKVDCYSRNDACHCEVLPPVCPTPSAASVAHLSKSGMVTVSFFSMLGYMYFLL